MTKAQKSASRNNYLTPTECARGLNVATVTLRKWAQQGMLEAVVTPGGHRRYSLAAVVEFAQKYNLPFDYAPPDIERILIVDDDPQICRLLTALFENFADLVVTEQVHDGFEAGLRVHSFQPSIILLDLMMPGIDGFEVCRLIKGDVTTQHIRVIAITGFNSEENSKRIIEAGAEACLSKPIRQAELLETIGLNKYVRL